MEDERQQSLGLSQSPVWSVVGPAELQHALLGTGTVMLAHHTGWIGRRHKDLEYWPPHIALSLELTGSHIVR